MEILDTDARYDLFHNIYLNTHKGKVELTADEALDVAYAIVDSYRLDYKILDKLQDAYEKDKEAFYEEDVGERNKREAYFEAMDRDYDDYIFEEMND